MKKRLWVTVVSALFPVFAAAGADTAPRPPAFAPQQTFAPFVMPDGVNAYRSANGTPGPAYWQNRADYRIRVRLQPEHKRLLGTETIVYVNHSPDTLRALWLQLDQNRYRPDARANFSGDEMPAAAEHTAGYRFDSVQIQANGQTYAAQTLISDTRMRITLRQPLAAHGGRVILKIRYRYTVPAASFGGRTGWANTPHGRIFDIAQWYPRLCVYDDIRGWNTAPFLNQEFYNEYGDFDYAVTVPWNMLVAGAGTLENPGEVLTASQRQRLEKARHSDDAVMIRPPSAVDDAASRPADRGELTWRFHMANTRDVAFAASRAFVWDAARVNLPRHQSALAMSLYPPESGGARAWGRSTAYLKHTIEEFSRRWTAYPYPTAVAVGGPVGGMEYPGIVFDSARAKGEGLFMITAHEIGHTWFPMLVGSDERRHGWMDEGFNTFIDIYASDDFNHGEYAPKRDSEFAPGGGNPVTEILKVLDDPNAPPIMTRTDLIPETYRHPVTYFKAALGLQLLREQILGPRRFDPAFKQYIRAWAYKHPKPSDFFRAMDSAAGEDLSWFWRGWFAHNWRLDMAITKVAPAKGGFDNGARVTIVNRDRLVMPATLRVTYADGSHRDTRVPVATWMLHRRFTVVVPGHKAVRAAEIDPGHVIPDDDRSNNLIPVATGPNRRHTGSAR